MLIIASGTFKVAGGVTTTIKLHLSAKARGILARSRKLLARATIATREASGAVHATQTTVTIRAARVPHGH